MYKTIVVPLDGSTFAEQALPYALQLSKASGARLVLVLAHEVPGMAMSDLSVPGMDRLDEEAREWEQDYLRSLAKRLREDAKQPTSTIFDSGPVTSSALEEAVKEQHADLVVMTTHGRSGLARAWLGSVADALARRLDVPMLLIRPVDETTNVIEPAAAFRRVLAPVDGTATAEAALPHALKLAKLTGGGLTLLRVAFAPPTTLSNYLPEQAFMNRLDLGDQRKAAQAYLDKTASELRGETMPPVETHVVTSHSPALGILDAARDMGADIIVMGTHARGPVARAVLGSVADKVVRGADRPVMIYRAG